MNISDFENLKAVADDAMSNSQHQKAYDIWCLLYSDFPEHATAWAGFAKAHAMLQQWEEAETLLEKAIKIFPYDLNLFIVLSDIYLSQRKYKQAEELLNKANGQFAKSEELQFIRMRLFINAKLYEKAEKIAEKLILEFPNNNEIIKEYAELATNRKDWKEAERRWALYREKFPQDYLGFEQSARCLRELGKTQAARKLLLTYEYGELWNEEVEGNKHGRLLTIPERRNLSSNINLIITKALFNLKSEASRNKLSYLWWIIEPVLYMLVFYIVFTFILNRGGPDYVIVLLTGMVPFTWFSKGVQVSSTSILYGRSILENIKISAIFFPAVSVVQTTIKETPVFLILLVFLAYYGIYPDLHWIQLVPVIICEAFLIFALGLLCAIFVPFLKDLQQVIPTFIQFLMFVSSVFYSLDVIPEKYHHAFLLNPIANIIYQYRLVIVQQTSLDWGLIKILILQIMLLLLISSLFFYILRERFLKAIMS